MLLRMTSVGKVGGMKSLACVRQERKADLMGPSHSDCQPGVTTGMFG